MFAPKTGFSKTLFLIVLIADIFYDYFLFDYNYAYYTFIAILVISLDFLLKLTVFICCWVKISRKWLKYAITSLVFSILLQSYVTFKLWWYYGIVLITVLNPLAAIFFFLSFIFVILKVILILNFMVMKSMLMFNFSISVSSASGGISDNIVDMADRIPFL
ncbi:hypothetical protein TCON_2212 [Astathelohania contejeani]|uniref:Uncharacterized protein n=1 Tax=Astathelohania contejeani TaxID=164912 RepID=A0ABQ7HWT6_9MICR|nr:hypothetical protein TCON_2212 [Thelohania contejeani]